MNAAVLVLFVLNFSAIGLLPILFFRRDGKFNLLWFATAAPFIVSPLILLASFAGLMRPFHTSISQDIIATLLSAFSVGLLMFTWGTHRTRLALWHQENDAPESIVTYGAYRYVRHPFYLSFLLALLGSFIYCPHVATLVTLIYAATLLNITAAREEKRLSGSAFGDEYRSYVKRTGRFWPSWKGNV